ncbi:hypothetical protein BDF22DRAFT_693104 [Syncephalis plumigaleata]|nr:hypothetical protein BDF22DRAFT_693104 [Syncephalis plumigaleata]
MSKSHTTFNTDNSPLNEAANASVVNINANTDTLNEMVGESKGHKLVDQSRTLTTDSGESDAKYNWTSGKPYPAISIDSRDSMRTVTPQSTVNSVRSQDPNMVDNNDDSGDHQHHLVVEPIRGYDSVNGTQNDTIISNMQGSVILMEHMRDALGTVSYGTVWDDTFATSHYPTVLVNDNTMILREELGEDEFELGQSQSVGTSNKTTRKRHNTPPSRRARLLGLLKLSRKTHRTPLTHSRRSTIRGRSILVGQPMELPVPLDQPDTEAPDSVAVISTEIESNKSAKQDIVTKKWWRWRRQHKARTGGSSIVIAPQSTDTPTRMEQGTNVTRAHHIDTNPLIRLSEEDVQDPIAGIHHESVSPDSAVSGHASHVATAISQHTHSTSSSFPTDEPASFNTNSNASKRYSPLFALPPPLAERPELPRRLFYYSEPYRRGVARPPDTAHPTSPAMQDTLALQDVQHKRDDHRHGQTGSTSPVQSSGMMDLSPFAWQTQEEVRIARRRSRTSNERNTTGRPSQHYQMCIDGEGHHFARQSTFCGICWSILFFPCGLLCCYTPSERRCKKCRQHVSRRHYQ